MATRVQGCIVHVPLSWPALAGLVDCIGGTCTEVRVQRYVYSAHEVGRLLKRVPRWAAEGALSPLQRARARPVLTRPCRQWARCVQPEAGAVCAQLIKLVVVGAQHTW